MKLRRKPGMEKKHLEDSLKQLERPKPLTDKEKSEAYVVKTNIDDGPNASWNRHMATPDKKGKKQ